MTAQPWEAWAPPLDPPTPGGLPYDQAKQIAAEWWDHEPHECAARQWESYAATLPPTPAVAVVTTGAQSITYGAARPGGDYGLAIERAAWHRSFLDTVTSVPIRKTPQLARRRTLSGRWP